jgi:hypothetical protein
MYTQKLLENHLFDSRYVSFYALGGKSLCHMCFSRSQSIFSKSHLHCLSIYSNFASAIFLSQVHSSLFTDFPQICWFYLRKFC